jgi:hypothetical protein
MKATEPGIGNRESGIGGTHRAILLVAPGEQVNSAWAEMTSDETLRGI